MAKCMIVCIVQLLQQGHTVYAVGKDIRKCLSGAAVKRGSASEAIMTPHLEKHWANYQAEAAAPAPPHGSGL